MMSETMNEKVIPLAIRTLYHDFDGSPNVSTARLQIRALLSQLKQL